MRVEELISIIILSWNWACHGRAVSDQYMGALQLVPSSPLQLPVQQIWRPCCSLCVPGIPQRALKGSSGDRNLVHAISHVSAQFAFYITPQRPTYVSKMPVKWHTLLVHSWVLIELSFKGIKAAANRWFHSANKHGISTFHCTLPPPC